MCQGEDTVLTLDLLHLLIYMLIFVFFFKFQILVKVNYNSDCTPTSLKSSTIYFQPCFYILMASWGSVEMGGGEHIGEKSAL